MSDSFAQMWYLEVGSYAADCACGRAPTELDTHQIQKRRVHIELNHHLLQLDTAYFSLHKQRYGLHTTES